MGYVSFEVDITLSEKQLKSWSMLTTLYSVLEMRGINHTYWFLSSRLRMGYAVERVLKEKLFASMHHNSQVTARILAGCWM